MPSRPCGRVTTKRVWPTHLNALMLLRDLITLARLAKPTVEFSAGAEAGAQLLARVAAGERVGHQRLHTASGLTNRLDLCDAADLVFCGLRFASQGDQRYLQMAVDYALCAGIPDKAVDGVLRFWTSAPEPANATAAAQP